MRVADVGRGQRAPAVGRLVRQRHGLDRPHRLDRRLQQRGVEAEQVRAVGGRTLGEDGDILAGAEQRIDLGIDDLGVAAAAAAQEDRVGLRREPADERPGADLGLGDESHGPRRVEDEDVDPGDVVGDDQAARLDAAERCVEADVELLEQAPRPALLEAQALAVGGERKDATDIGRAPQQVQGEAQYAQEAQRQGSRSGGCGCVDFQLQSFFPMKWRA